jgi:hypothetical protein
MIRDGPICRLNSTKIRRLLEILVRETASNK